MRSVRRLWDSLSLKNKLNSFAALILMSILLLATVSVVSIGYSIKGFGTILDDDVSCQNFQESFDQEVSSFENYVRGRDEKYLKQLQLSSAQTMAALEQLPGDYRTIGTERYARTWNLRNAYEHYSGIRDAFLDKNLLDADYVSQLYRIYDMQRYIQLYARRLVTVTFEAGNRVYQHREDSLKRVPLFVSALTLGLAAAVLCMNQLLARSLFQPVLRLAQMARRIARNDYDFEVEPGKRQDEIGELMLAFEKMKLATGGYISALQENNLLSERLHRDELEKMEMEKRLEAARMEFLKSQINPHFLFNTLNTIAGMAELEEAETSRQMIQSLSRLFRYNLNTKAQQVPLESELKIVRDYMYLQHMRFGSRVTYREQIELDAQAWQLPSFTLQPLVENAVIHGLSKQERGGAILVAADFRGKLLRLRIADTGSGMSREQLTQLREALQTANTSRVGIGLGNIYQRLHSLYRGADMRLYSSAGRGSLVVLYIPQEE